MSSHDALCQALRRTFRADVEPVEITADSSNRSLDEAHSNLFEFRLSCRCEIMRSLRGKLNLSLGALTVLVLLFLLAAFASTQTPTPSTQQSGAAATPAPTPDHKVDNAAAQNAVNDQAKPGDDARQAQLVADTAKLFQLAQELQAEVAKSGKNTLSISVMKKAAEVEKLARSLKERMRNQ